MTCRQSTAGLLAALLVVVLIGQATVAYGAPAPVLSGFLLTPSVFSPRAVLAPRAATVAFTLSVKARVTVVALDSSGRLVRTVLKPTVLARKAYRYSWTGARGDGTRAPDGVYRIKVTAAAGARRQEASAKARLDATPPPLSLAAGPNPYWPAWGGSLGRLTVTARTGAERVRIQTRVSGRGASVTWTDNASGTVRHSWNGRAGSARLGWGTATVRSVARDSAGNQTAVTRSVRVRPYSDLSSPSGEIGQAIYSAIGRHIAVARGGLYSGDSKMAFRPGAAATRGDLAALLVRAFAPTAAAPSPAPAFSDVTAGSALAKYAAIVVAKGWMDDYAGGGASQFRPTAPATGAMVARGLTRALGMKSLAARIAAQDPGTPWWGGDTVVMQDLRLRRHGAGERPGIGYRRGELAYSVIAALTLAPSAKSALKSEFSVTKPIVESVRQREWTLSARKLLGEPYLWGGGREPDPQHGYDCSGMVWHIGMYDVSPAQRRSLGGTADDQFHDRAYPTIAYKNLAPGDGVYFGSGHITHAGMYLGNGYFIHSSGSRNGVSIDRFTAGSYWLNALAGGKRYIPMVELRSAAISPLLFSPNGDGIKDTMGVSFRTTKEATVTVAACDAAGRRIATLMSGRKKAGTYSLTWNGTNAGKAVADGRYLMRIDAVDEELNRRSFTKWVTLDTKPPSLTSPDFAPDPFSPASQVATISVTVGEPIAVTLEIADTGGTVAYRTVKSVTAPGRLKVTWKGIDWKGGRLAAGRYQYRFRATDAAGNTKQTGYLAFTLL